MKIQACDVHVHPNYDNICDRFSFFFLHVRFWREEKAIKSEGRIYFFLSFKSFFTLVFHSVGNILTRKLLIK